LTLLCFPDQAGHFSAAGDVPKLYDGPLKVTRPLSISSA
jgi:hypothetical protein